MESFAGKTAVVYARYSSDKQRDASIEDQLRVVGKWCQEHGVGVVATYADRALSGKTDHRPQFRKMIANAPESDLVLVYSFDRFSRDRYDAATYKKTLRECGVRVVSATEPVEETPEGGLQEGLLELLSEYYVKDLARKIRRGLEGNALKAKDNGYRIYGYRTDPETRRYVVEPSEARVVRDVYDSYIRDESIYAIAERLSRAGIKSATGKPVDYNWVLRVLHRKCYTGLYSWDGIEVPGGMPAIISNGTWQAAQDRPKHKPRSQETWTDYPLTGRLYCGICGCPMHGYSGTSKTGRIYHYYGCKEQGGCHRRGVRKDAVEGSLKDAILKVTADEDTMRMVARRVVAAYDSKGDAQEELREIDGSIRALEAEQHRLTDAALQGFVNAEVVKRNAELDAEIRRLHDRRGILESQDMELTEDDIVEFLAHGVDERDADMLVDAMVRRVWLFEDSMVVVMAYRDEVGGLAEVRAALGAGSQDFACPARGKKNPSSRGELGSNLLGVGGGT